MSWLEAVYDAIESDDVDGLNSLLARRERLSLLNEGTPPPLHWAIYHDRPTMVGRLIDHGANLQLRDPDRDATPLQYAVVYARREIIRELIDRGVDATEGLPVAKKGAAGGFCEYDELPSSNTYKEILKLLESLKRPDN